jgi:hypothetical protein
MQLERLEIGDESHYHIRLRDSEPEFSSLLQKGKIFVQKKARLQPLNQARESESPLHNADAEGWVHHLPHHSRLLSEGFLV